MNGTPTFTIMNPLAKVVEESENIIALLQEASDDLEYRIADEHGWASQYRDALTNYEMAENDKLSEVIIQAQLKEGPLAGVPVSGKGYDIVLTKLKNDLKRGDLAGLWRSVDQVRRNLEDRQTALVQAQTRFAALRKVVELKANILRAATV